MQTLQTNHGVDPVRKAGKLVSVAAVGSLHIAVIYALLVALDIVPSPVAPTPPDIMTTVLDQTKTVPKVPVLPGPVLALPAAPKNPTPPPITMQNEPSDPTTVTENSAAGPETPAAPNSGITAPLRAMTATHTIPPYPPLAMRLGYEGTVRVRLAVDDQGNVSSADVVNSSGHADLDQAAVAWVKEHWRYQPAMQNGRAVPATASAVVAFTLNQMRG